MTAQQKTLGDPSKDHWYERTGSAGDDEAIALGTLLKAVPATAGALLTWLDYIANIPDLDYRATASKVLQTVTEAARDLIGGEAA